MTSFLVNLASCITINFILFRQLSERYEKTIKKRCIILLLLITLITALINVYDIPMLNIVITFIGFMLMKKMFNATSFENIGRDFISFLILIMIDSFCYFITGFVYGDQFAIECFRPLTSSVMVLFLSSLVFKTFRYSKIDKVPKYEMILFFMITGFSVILIYIFSLEYSMIKVEHKIMVTLIIICILIMNIIVFHYLEYVNNNYEMKEKMLYEETKMQMMNQYYQNMKSEYSKTRELIHDFKNHMYAMSLAYEQNKINLAENIMKQFNEECNKNKIAFMTKSDLLNIILSEKSLKSEKLGIKFDFKMEDIDLSWVKELDLITIFGNLIDNAIEANQEIDLNMEKYIEIRVYQKNLMVIIKISNSCQNLLKKKTNKGYQTTKDGHSGIGLQSVQKAVESYNGIFEIEINDLRCETVAFLIK